MKNREDNIVRREDGKVIGKIDKNIFVRHILGSKYFTKMPAGIVNDISVLQSIEARGVRIVEVIDDETKKEYFATLKMIWKKGMVINRGYGKQCLLLFKYWSKTFEDAKDPVKELQQERLFQ